MISPREWHAKSQGTGEWEDIVAAIDCNYYQILDPANGSFEKCSDPADASTSTTRTGGFAVIAPPHGEWRWNKGEHITWVKSSGALDLYFLR